MHLNLSIATACLTAILAAAPATAAPVTPVFTSFGALAAATFGGSGIPNDAVAITQIVDGDNVITLGLTAHQRYFNPPLVNDGAGTFAAGPGSNFGDPGNPGGPGPGTALGATWNFAFYVDIGAASP